MLGVIFIAAYRAVFFNITQEPITVLLLLVVLAAESSVGLILLVLYTRS